VLYALAHPFSFGVLLLSYVLGLTLHGLVQTWAIGLLSGHRVRRSARLKPDPRVHLDPFGAVAALISGLGWAVPVDVSRLSGTGRRIVVALAGPAVNVVLGVGLLAAVRLSYGPSGALSTGASSVLQHGAELHSAAAVVTLVGASQLYLGVLALVPVPPLDGAVVLFGLAPRTRAWLQAEHHLGERNIGVAVLLALLVVPLGGPVPILPQLLDTVLGPVLSLLLGP
jgi:Zn-dependent protease